MGEARLGGYPEPGGKAWGMSEAAVCWSPLRALAGQELL